MGKDPAFLFYPGDYLRDTQILSEDAQVAYDRIMCEHMRNICITQQQLKFFTKRLNDESKEELMSVLTKVNGGYQISWVALSIEKRRAYSESRRKNREGKTKNISKTYDKHMEIEIENGIRINNEGGVGGKNNRWLKEKKTFEQARKIYPGTKRGLETEFKHFTKKTEDWKDVLPLLRPAIIKQIEWRNTDKWRPEWKHFKTWINNRGWEEEVSDTNGVLRLNNAR